MNSYSVGIVCPYDISRKGGVQTLVFDQLSILKKLNIRSKIITPKPKKDIELINDINLDDFIFIGNIKETNLLQTTVNVSINKLFIDESTLSEIKKFDILHFHEPWVPFLSPTILLHYKGKKVATFHATPSEKIITKAILGLSSNYLDWVIDKFDEIITVSESPLQFLKKHTKKQIHIIENSIDIQKSFNIKEQNEKVVKEKNTILYVGRLEERKGVKYLIKAFSKLSYQIPSAKLIIAGKGKKLKKFKKLSDKLNIKNIEYLTNVSEEKKYELINSTTIFCSPAIYGESFGISLLEAMSQGKAVIGGYNLGYKSLLSGLGSFLLVNPKKITRFANLLQTLLINEKLRKIFEKWSFETSKKYDVRILFQKNLVIYENLLKPKF